MFKFDFTTFNNFVKLYFLFFVTAEINCVFNTFFVFIETSNINRVVIVFDKFVDNFFKIFEFGVLFFLAATTILNAAHFYIRRKRNVFRHFYRRSLS